MNTRQINCSDAFSRGRTDGALVRIASLVGPGEPRTSSINGCSGSFDLDTELPMIGRMKQEES